jgi:pimeloyl-ACP methyl ester carboxylesterase
MPEYTTSTDGTRIAFEAIGTGPAVVLVAGAFGTRESMRPLADLLRDRFTAVIPDRRGRGDSGPTAWVSAQQQVDDLLAVAGATGATRLFGHSSGAVLVLLAAAVSPAIAEVAAYEPPVQDRDPEGAAAFATDLRALLAAGRADDATVDWFRRTSAGRFDETMRTAPWWPALVALAHTLPDEQTLIGNGGVPTAVGRIAARALLISGGASPAWAAAATSALAATIPDATIAVIPGGGHAVRPGALAPVLAAFFRP